MFNILSQYIKYIKIGSTLLIVAAIVSYIFLLKHTITVQKKDIANLDGNVSKLHDTILKNNLVCQINEKTLTDALLDQSNEINKFKINEKVAKQTFDEKVAKISSTYTTKIIYVKDSNTSPSVECNTLAEIIDTELK